MPFTVLGAPWHKGFENAIKRDSVTEAEMPSHLVLNGLESEYLRFTPRSTPGKAASPDFQDQACYGIRFLNRVEGKDLFKAGITLLKNMVEEAGNTGMSATLYQPSFNILMGNGSMKTQLKQGKTVEEIYQSWQPALGRFKVVRKKYLLYPDFSEA